MNRCALLTLFLFMLSCAGTQKSSFNEFICREHVNHPLADKKKFADCFSIDPAAIDAYLIFSKESPLMKSDSAHTVSYLRDKVTDEITELIIQRLQIAFDLSLTGRWQLERTDFPVVFRSFVKINDKGSLLKSVALVRKADLEPRALIRFLPLEYKMKLMKPEGNEKDMKDLLK